MTLCLVYIGCQWRNFDANLRHCHILCSARRDSEGAGRCSGVLRFLNGEEIEWRAARCNHISARWVYRPPTDALRVDSARWWSTRGGWSRPSRNSALRTRAVGARSDNAWNMELSDSTLSTSRESAHPKISDGDFREFLEISNLFFTGVWYLIVQ